MRFLLFLFVFAQLSTFTFGGNKIVVQDSLQKRKVQINIFLGTGLQLYNGVNSQIMLDLAFPLHLEYKARYGPVFLGAFGQISKTCPNYTYYSNVNSSGMFAGAGYYGKKFSIGAGGGGAFIFSTEYFKGGPVSPNLINVPPSHKYYSEFGYCGSVFMSFDNPIEWLRVSIQYSLIRTYRMRVTNLLLIGFEFGRR